MSQPLQPRVQLFAQLRSAHLERARQRPAATLLYRGRRFDFDESLLAGLDVRQLGAVATARALFTSGTELVEVNEPLMRNGLARSALALSALALRRRLRGRHATVVSYAIENRNPFRPVPGGVSARARARRAVERRLSRYVTRRLDRVAFGTPAAEALYRELLGRALRHVATRAVPAVPAPCNCLAGAPTPEDRDLVVFLGALSDRKGVPELIAAWPLVAGRRPGAHLALRGAGPLEAEVRSWTEQQPAADLAVGVPRDEVHTLLRRAAVLVLFSQPAPAWREQVGLPVVEALAHGCAVVASSETGLAPWLAAHGHRVLPPDAGAEALADAVVAALAECRPRASVLADLPAVDGRLAADGWLAGEEDAPLAR